MKNVEQFDSTAEFIAAGLHYSNGADFDRRLEFAASAGMNQSTPAEGGFLTAPRVTTEAVITKAEETSLLLARVLKLPMGSSNRAAFPVVDEIPAVQMAAVGAASYWAGPTRALLSLS